MKLLCLFAILSLLTFGAFAQDTTRLKQQARLMISSLQLDDYETIVEHTYPSVQQVSGGKEKMLQSLKESMKQME